MCCNRNPHFSVYVSFYHAIIRQTLFAYGAEAAAHNRIRRRGKLHKRGG